MNTNIITIGFDNSEIDRYTLQAANTLDDMLSVKKIICAHVKPEFDVTDALFHKKKVALSTEKNENSVIIDQLKNTQGYALDNITKQHTNIVIKHGGVMPGLIKILEENSANLLVLGQHPVANGHGTLIRNLIRRSSTNVLLVPKVALRKVKKVVVALDFSAHSEKVVETINQMAHIINSPLEITFVNVSHKAEFEAYRDHQQNTEFTRGETRTNRAYKDLITKYEFPNYCKLEFIELIADSSRVHESIINTAKEEKADLIVVGNIGHSPYKQFYLGSVAEKLTLTDLPCATLFVSVF